MAYDTKELEKRALHVIERENLVFIHEVCSFMNLSKQTFYEHKLDESNQIKAALDKNKSTLKAGLRKKWYDSDNATTQIALYKLIGTDEESDRINSQRNKVEVDGGIQVIINKHVTSSD